MKFHVSPKAATHAAIASLILAGLLYAISMPLKGGPAASLFLDPWDGLYRTARNANLDTDESADIPFIMQPVTVARDSRGVPHIFAESDRDAIIALGYAVAQDRLFQLDYISRVASGRLSEVFGPDLVNTDRYLRHTGMYTSAVENLARIESEGGIELQVTQWFTNGVNSYINTLEDKDLPVEFRLVGYKPEPYTVLGSGLLMQFMIFDLTFQTDDPDYSALLAALGSEAFRKLYPKDNYYSVPIVDEPRSSRNLSALTSVTSDTAFAGRVAVPPGFEDRVGGYIEGKGSNNWVVSGSRSATGHPILAGDMHLGLTLPAVWFETHLVTPSMNSYGVTIPGSPLPVEAFNKSVGWAFTNTGADQIDFYNLDLDSAGTGYFLDGEFRPFELFPDTIFVKGVDPVLDTLKYSHWGPVVETDSGAYAIAWVAHHMNRNVEALWGMNHAADLYQFTEATKFWDAPLQNIIVADVSGDIAIRSTGLLPIRNEASYGLIDGSTIANGWSGRVAFDRLPASTNPSKGFLTSTNQQPATSWYPYYLGNDWGSSFRSMRIDSLLRAKTFHSVDDIKSYQADTKSVQHGLLHATLKMSFGDGGLSVEASDLQAALIEWSGFTTTDSREAVLFDVWYYTLKRLLWDEEMFSIRSPTDATFIQYIAEVESSAWFDVVSTPNVESKADLISLAFEEAAVSLGNYFDTVGANTTWGETHKILFRHLTRSDVLSALWRGPFAYPGFSETLSPGRGREVVHSASWRMVVDFSTERPTGYGVYPGGQSGNPFSKWYDSNIDTYLNFEYFNLLTPDVVEDLDPDSTTFLYLNPQTTR